MRTEYIIITLILIVIALAVGIILAPHVLEDSQKEFTCTCPIDILSNDSGPWKISYDSESCSIISPLNKTYYCQEEE